MKKILLIAGLSLISTIVFAETLISCNPPGGSSLQEVKIIVIGGKYFRTELNSSGAFS